MREALELLLYSASKREANQLESLTLVDKYLTSPDLPDSPQARKFALQEVLVTAITDEFIRQRTANGSLPPSIADDVKAVRAAIAADAKTGNPELIGWSWLYYHFVRVDLNISYTQYSEASWLEERTIRRYQRHAIWRLTTLLLEHERAANLELRKQRLYAHLPTAAPVRLFGRDPVFDQVEHALQDWPPHHFQVIGEPGIGKTVFVQEVVRQHIDADEIDYLIWSKEPESVAEVRSVLSAELHAERTGFSLRDYAARYELALVVDNAEHLRSDIKQLEALLDDLSTEVVYIANASFLPLPNVFNIIRLTRLGKNDAFSLIRAVAKGWYSGEMADVPEDTMYEIWEQFGGNPAAIKQAVQDLQQDNLESAVWQ